jgi:hypothetical protein
LHIGGSCFLITQGTLQRIPALYEAILPNEPSATQSASTASAAVAIDLTAARSEASDAKDAKHDTKDMKKMAVVGRRYWVDGDADVYAKVVSYASGKRAFLVDEPERLLKRMLAEANRLRMDDLRADLEWLVCPQPDAEMLAILDQAAAVVAQLAELPAIRELSICEYLRESARQKNHTVADELRDLFRNLARSPECAAYMRLGKVMPSLRANPKQRPIDAPPGLDDNPHVLTTLVNLVSEWLRFYLPRAMLAAAFNRIPFIQHILPLNQNPAPPPNPPENQPENGVPENHPEAPPRDPHQDVD